MLRLDSVRGMVKKEFRQLLRDPRLRAMIIAPPVMMLLVFGYAANTDVDSVTFTLVDYDKTYQGREFVSSFTASPVFTCHSIVPTVRDASRLLDAGDVDFILTIPAGFGADVTGQKGASVQVLLDGADSSRASVVLSYVNAVADGYGRSVTVKPVNDPVADSGGEVQSSIGGVDVRERILFNQNLRSLNFFLPSLIGLVVTLITIMLTSMSIVKERESGTMEQINVSPLKPQEYILGKLIPFGIVAFADIIIITLLAIGWFDIPFRGSFIFLLLCGLLYILSTLSVGLYISTISETQQQAMLSSFLFFLPAILLSGFIFPVYSMPESIQLITYFNPLRYFIEIVRAVFLKGAGFTILWPQMAVLLVFGMLLLFLSVKRYSKRMA